MLLLLLPRHIIFLFSFPLSNSFYKYYRSMDYNITTDPLSDSYLNTATSTLVLSIYACQHFPRCAALCCDALCCNECRCDGRVRSFGSATWLFVVVCNGVAVRGVCGGVIMSCPRRGVWRARVDNSQPRGDAGSSLERAASPFTHLPLKGFPNEICPLLKPEGGEGESWEEGKGAEGLRHSLWVS